MPRRKATLITAVLAMVMPACSSNTPAPAAKKGEPQLAKITAFYTAAPVVAPGANVTICYGVENAISVSLKPAVEPLKPAFNRCFEARVPRETEFTLTARGAGGDEVSASFTVGVSKAATAPPRESTPSGPLISSFTAEPSRIAPGSPPVKLCYQAFNAQFVTIEPKVADLGRALMGCFYAPTQKTTTYILTARGAGGATDVKRVVVAVQ